MVRDTQEVAVESHFRYTPLPSAHPSRDRRCFSYSNSRANSHTRRYYMLQELGAPLEELKNQIYDTWRRL